MSWGAAWRLAGILLVLGHSSGSLLAQSSGLSVTVTAQPTNPSPVAVGSPLPAVTLTATAQNVPAGTYTCPVSLASWSWSYTLAYATQAGGPWGPPPAAASTAVSISPSALTNPTTASLQGMFGTAGYWQVTPTATVVYADPCGNTWTASGTGSPVTFTVVGIAKVQFQLPGGAFQDVPASGLYVATGTTVAFQALPSPTGAPWPAGQPVWGGVASGTGPTTSVTFSQPSQNMSDYQFVTATCGNTISVPVIRYGPDQATLSYSLDSSSGAVLAYVTYTLWAPDSTGTGQPDAPGGDAILKAINFDDPANSCPTEVTRWAFSNGVSYSQTYVLYTVNMNDAYTGNAGPNTNSLSRRGNGRSIYRRLRGDDPALLCQLIAKEAMDLFKQVGGPQALEFLVKKLVAYFENKTVDLTPASPTSSSFDINLGGGTLKTVKVTITTLANQSRTLFDDVFWVKDPSVEAKVEGDTSTFTKAGTDYYLSQTVIVWNSLKGLIGADGWTKPTAAGVPRQAEWSNSLPGRQGVKVGGMDPGKVFGAINYQTIATPPVAFGNYKRTKAIDKTGASVEFWDNPATPDGNDLLSKVQTINWPHL
jgi:hypothetical protein